RARQAARCAGDAARRRRGGHGHRCARSVRANRSRRAPRSAKGARMMVWVHFVIYGLLGWSGEITFPSSSDRVPGQRQADGDRPGERLPITRGDRLALCGRTYLWMFPIYGLCAFGFEPLHDAIRGWAWPLRGLIYMAGIFLVEAI